MGDTNYFSGIVKILENPKESLVKETIPFITFRVEISQIKKNRIMYLRFWGRLANEVKKYYRKDDYILVEGYLSARNKIKLLRNKKKAKQISITVLRVYPIFLNSNLQDNGNNKV